MKKCVFHNVGMNGCGGSTWTNKLILSRNGMKISKVMEKLKIKRSRRRGFSAMTLLQISGLKVSLVNPTL